MSNTDLRLYTLNGVAVALSFSSIEGTLRILLVIASLFYTILKIVETIKKKYNDNKGDNI
jgi:hypothetical protein